MALSQRLEVRQSQNLVMTPQLQQAIKLLQLSNLELSAYVEQQLEQNPLLERGESDPAAAREEAEEAAEEAADNTPDNAESEPAVADTVELGSSEYMAEASDAPLDTEYENDWSSDEPQTPPQPDSGSAAFESWGSGGQFDPQAAGVEQNLTKSISLREHLHEQLQMDIEDPVDRMVGLHLIEMLDEAGYLVGELEAVAEILNCPLDQVERTLAKLQRFDPPGIFARSLKECLAAQLRDRNHFDPMIETLLDHLDLLAAGNIPGLKRACNVDAEDLADMVAEIRTLDPKPALAFDETVAQPVNPDVLMRPQHDGGWLVELNNETLPRVLLNTHYHARVSKQARDREEKEYINECFQTASWLVKALHQRATTILRVATEIVRQQDAFFAHGVQYLRPLILRDIAEAIEMHESTVSRVTANKFIATPRGMYELKYFFTSSIASAAGGEAHSAESVRHRIKALIDAEAAAKVLSDDKIVEILRDDGVDIARRTVAKYREAMRIPSSVQRRRAKKSAL